MCIFRCNQPVGELSDLLWVPRHRTKDRFEKPEGHLGLKAQYKRSKRFAKSRNPVRIKKFVVVSWPRPIPASLFSICPCGDHLRNE
jgi:hypothetical protein